MSPEGSINTSIQLGQPSINLFKYTLEMNLYLKIYILSIVQVIYLPFSLTLINLFILISSLDNLLKTIPSKTISSSGKPLLPLITAAHFPSFLRPTIVESRGLRSASNVSLCFGRRALLRYLFLQFRTIISEICFNLKSSEEKGCLRHLSPVILFITWSNIRNKYWNSPLIIIKKYVVQIIKIITKSSFIDLSSKQYNHQ